ncbi:hypothetical protein [Ferrimonas marina]|uniref:Uncharacterized protein n=1 Tax=Ferrimonas marina TaxID=299255 RepID=A0A1M5UBP9_9GAMM|nr:hypothetical protein [Ferrimonas marina]SHH60266.1 hypothetical protein SAMN02745129_2487 [Ferrimonas marina]
MSDNIEFLTVVLLMVVPMKALPWLLLAGFAYRGYQAQQESRRQRRLAAKARPEEPEAEPGTPPITANQLEHYKLHLNRQH